MGYKYEWFDGFCTYNNTCVNCTLNIAATAEETEAYATLAAMYLLFQLNGTHIFVHKKY